MTTPQPTLREAYALLAALRRWRREEDPGVVAAKRDLCAAMAAQLTAEASRPSAGRPGRPGRRGAPRGLRDDR